MNIKENEGVLLSNTKKTKDSDHDYWGEAVINQQKYNVNAWVNHSKDGKKYVRLVFRKLDLDL